jgi:uncharacterized tellurite resistance protein B-like protein
MEFIIFTRSKYQTMETSDNSASRTDKRNLSHFANIVRIAKSDDEVSIEEMQLLSEIAKKYKITDEQFEEILKDPDKVPTIERLDLEERIERLYELMQMVEADRRINKEEVDMLKKIVTGLSFPFNDIDRIVMESLKTDLHITNIDRFKRDIYKLLKIK